MAVSIAADISFHDTRDKGNLRISVSQAADEIRFWTLPGAWCMPWQATT
jgi:hypothetical protein